MAVTEKQRHDLFRKIEEAFGGEHAATMMELLPSVGWADVATKRDLDALEVRLEARLEARLSRIFGTRLFAAMGAQTAVIGLLLALAR